MHAYQSCPPDIVKSVRQRWLYVHWARLRGDRVLPRWSELDARDLDSCFDDLTILDVLAQDRGMRFRIHNHGKNVGAMYAGQCAGKFFDEVLPAQSRRATIETYEHAARSRLPVYTVSRTTDVKGRAVLYERLLLPFAESGDNTFRVIGFLETISPEGAFERHGLMLTEPRNATGFAIKAVLQAGFRRSVPADGPRVTAI
jgi:hypothetical protein